jgi:hypothetical protein
MTGYSAPNEPGGIALDEPKGRASSGSGPITVGGFAGFGFGVFWYAWGKVGFWWAILYGVFWIPWLGYRVAEILKLGQ